MMDVLNFFSEFRRMCKASSDCTKCQYHGDMCDNAIELLEKTVAAVEKWSQEHPRKTKTRQSVFLKQYPEASIDEFGVLGVCPFLISTSHRGAHGGCAHVDVNCTYCRREFWMQEVE